MAFDPATVLLIAKGMRLANASSMTECYDVAVVGGGPPGLGAALMLGRSCRRVLVLDSDNPRNHAARAVHGFIGSDGIRPAALRASVAVNVNDTA